ncbi:MAG: hypothetical protein HZA01_07810 [Nitrospinae bacterium]|nr:hypothetical protein [Nitrospinota bacterium]
MTKIKLFRISYWMGAVFDALVIIPMLSPEVAGAVFGIPNFNPGNDYAMRIAASLMAGWTFLLLWADREPLERKGVLLLTVFPVLSGLILAGIFAVQSGLITPGNMLPAWIMQALLLVLFSFSYKNGKMGPP